MFYCRKKVFNNGGKKSLLSDNNLPLEIAEALNFAEQVLETQSRKLSKVFEHNHQKLLRAFQAARVSDYDLHGTTGYGLGDTGRNKLDEIVAAVMGTEKALIRHQFVSGTHAIASAL
ncbi:MAG: hypothetical protein GX248_08740, partial [Peptococcaceae bacterium]|nr:hypothetical protein [Peptococcaceae bacterium]